MTKEEKLPQQEWDPQLDGVIAAPNSHRVIFEDDTYRVLHVVLAPSTREPFHHHARRSDFIVTSSTPLRYFKADQSWDDIPERNVSTRYPYFEELEPEGLHSVENLSQTETYEAWRVEYKN